MNAILSLQEIINGMMVDVVCCYLGLLKNLSLETAHVNTVSSTKYEDVDKLFYSIVFD